MAKFTVEIFTSYAEPYEYDSIGPLAYIPVEAESEAFALLAAAEAYVNGVEQTIYTPTVESSLRSLNFRVTPL